MTKEEAFKILYLESFVLSDKTPAKRQKALEVYHGKRRYREMRSLNVSERAKDNEGGGKMESAYEKSMREIAREASEQASALIANGRVRQAFENVTNDENTIEALLTMIISGESDPKIVTLIYDALEARN